MNREKKIDVLDLTIEVLREHEKELDRIIGVLQEFERRFSRIVNVEEKIERLKALLKRWNEVHWRSIPPEVREEIEAIIEDVV